MSTVQRILLVEDDPNFGAVLKDYLSINNFDVTLATNGNFGWTQFNNKKFDLVILDIMMPEKDGFSLAEDIRKSGSNIPFIFLSARALKEDMIRGFKIGADDYIVKPFDSELLILKIRAVLGRSSGDPNISDIVDEFIIGNYRFTYSTRELVINDEVKRLSPREAELFRLLCQHLDKVLPRERILIKIWGDDSYFNARSMDVFITKIRKYLKKDPSIEIINIHGKGYRMVTQK